MSVKKEELLDKYEDLVWKIARLYPSKSKADSEDAFQAGCLGLCEAFNRFDSKKGSEFSTFAYYWIQKYIREFSRSNSFHVDIPAHQLQNSQKVHRTFIKIRTERMDRLEAIHQTAKSLDITVKEVYGALDVYQSHQDHSTYLDDPECVVAVQGNSDILNMVEISSQIDKLKKRASKFSKREQDMLNALYFGDDITCESISEAGKRLGISKQSAQELHKKAITKLKAAA